jgi:F0F1-type ATP synthase assembly protein I
MMLVITLLGLVLAVLIPRQATEAAQPAESSTAAAGEAAR